MNLDSSVHMETILGHVDELIDKGQLAATRRSNEVLVKFDKSKRKQSVRIAVRDDMYVFSSVVARMRDLDDSDLDDVIFKMWCRNGQKPVVTHALDGRRRIVGRAVCPIESTQLEEVLFYVLTLARESDQFEYVLSGKDLN